MSQCKNILSHLKRGRSLTAIQALDMFGVMRLAARVSDLRDSGHQIITTPIHRGAKRFASYSLKGAKK